MARDQPHFPSRLADLPNCVHLCGLEAEKFQHHPDDRIFQCIELWHGGADMLVDICGRILKLGREFSRKINAPSVADVFAEVVIDVLTYQLRGMTGIPRVQVTDIAEGEGDDNSQLLVYSHFQYDHRYPKLLFVTRLPALPTPQLHANQPGGLGVQPGLGVELGVRPDEVDEEVDEDVDVGPDLS